MFFIVQQRKNEESGYLYWVLVSSESIDSQGDADERAIKLAEADLLPTAVVRGEALFMPKVEITTHLTQPWPV